MSGETWAIVGVGVALASLILPGQWAIRRDVAWIGEQLVRVEGIIEGWLNPPPPAPRETPK
ncbi:MAG: hypothetical protein OYK82_00340 [Gammaproteobacteria bacterium]|nr:hypothetical protein [Gammaproteobacteria bacterium]